MYETLASVRAQLESFVDGAVEPIVVAPGSIDWLRSRLGLNARELSVLWLLIAHELCPFARRLLREINSEAVPDPTIDTIRRVVYGTEPRAWRELGPNGALQRLALIEWTCDPALPEHRRTLRAATRVLSLAHGEVELDPQLGEVAIFDAPAVSVKLEVAPEVVRKVGAAIAAGGMVILHGAAGSGRRSLLATVAARPLLQIDGRALDREQAKRQLRLLARECKLLDRVPLVVHGDEVIDLVEEAFDGLVLVTASRAPSRKWQRPPAVIEMPPLRGSQLASLWQRVLPEATPEDAELLATMYPLAPALVEAVGAIARREAAGTTMTPEHIEAGMRNVLDDRLAGLARRVEVTQRWEDLVLPDDQQVAVIELLARIRRRRRVYEEWGFAQKLGRGLGVSALFAGPPGTGKTMCAGLIARELRTELYQVDVSKIASKWIGETEKNLAALFDAAEAGHAILLFDEADALFGKRTAVNSSNDHHANQQVNYLLQRLESFSGICILTTNNDAAIDEAFRRRLSIHIRFPVPDIDERARLWEAMLPPAAPVDAELPFDDLARKYVMSGGYIRNAVLRAAFLAADEKTPITGYHLAQAAQLEYEAMGKIAAA